MEQGGNMQMPSPEKSNGPVVGIIVVIIVLVIGAYYLFAELQSQQALRDGAPEEMSQSTEVSDIEADVSAEQQDLNSLDAETNADLDSLDADLQNLPQ